MYSISLAPHHDLKQETRFTQTDKQPPKYISLGINLVSFGEFLDDCGREPFARDVRVRIAPDCKPEKGMDETPLVMMFFYQIQIYRYQ